MREILFRGKRVDNGEWVVSHGIYIDESSKVYLPVETSNGMQQVKVLPETVGQFTGLYDKNKARIWEGDVLFRKEDDEYYRVDSMFPVHRHTHVTNIGYRDSDGNFVPRENPAGQYDNMDDWMSWPEMYEVIGSIHDTPSLLNDKT